MAEDVALVRTGLGVTQGMVTPVMIALLQVVEDRGFALLGDSRAACHAVLEAERHYERARLDKESPWLGFWSASPHLRELDERITTLLTRTTRRQHGDHSM